MIREGLRSCVLCREAHFEAGAWAHKARGCWGVLDARWAAILAAASNNQPEGPAKASNSGHEDAAPASNKKQRWERAKYNEYMRAYMARRRAEAKAA